MKRILPLILLLSTCIVNAQKRLLPGTITQTNGKTIRIFLEPFYSQEKWKVIQYKLNPEGDWQNINVNEINEVKYDMGLTFRRFTVSVDKSRSENRNLQSSATPVWNTETAFLQLLVGGNYELYRYNEDGLTKFFYKTASDPVPVQLVYIRYSDREQVRESRPFSLQLMKLFGEPEAAYDKYRRLPYSENRLTELFMEKSGTTAQDYSEARKESRYFKSRIKVFANFTAAKIDAPEYEYKRYESFGPDVTIRYDNKVSSSEKVKATAYQIGAEGEVFFFGLIPKMSVVFSPSVFFGDYSQNDIPYRRVEQSNITNSVPITYPLTHNLSGKFASLQLPLGLRYYFLDGASKVNISAQGAVTIPAFTNEVTFTNANGEDNSRTNPKHKSSVGLLLGAEYSYQRLSVRLQYGRYGKLYDDMKESDWNYLSFGLGFALKK